MPTVQVEDFLHGKRGTLGAILPKCSAFGKGEIRFGAYDRDGAGKNMPEK